MRPADLDDINTIGFLAQQIWPDTYGNIVSQQQLQYMLNLIYSPTSLRRQMLDDKQQFMIVEQGDEPIGFASWSALEEPGVVKLHKLYVLPGRQGKGLGRSMIEFIFQAIRPEGAMTLRLNVNRYNTARQFYERMGFVVIKEEDIPIGNGYFMNDFVMEVAVPAQD
ncbi:GNAT family N-acetyltransferase [Puia dinghuensis]|nr:GNAT family N-acetyltransferase [Puia dinghuensis]